MKRGYLKTYIKTLFIILLICAIAITVGYYVKDEYDVEKLETIKTNMLLIEAKTKIIAEKVKIEEEGAKYIGEEIKKDTQDEKILELQEKEIININSKKKKYYKLNKENLVELGLENIALDNEYYIVEYNINEIIYPNGVQDENGNILYKLSEFQK